MDEKRMQYHKIPEDYRTNYLIEEDKVIDFTDNKWAHPVLADGWNATDAFMGFTYSMCSPDVSSDEKEQQFNAFKMSLASIQNDGEKAVDITSYTVPGCPEEPDASVEVRVYRPKTLNSKKARVLYYCLGGALVTVFPESFPIEEMCLRYNCVAVTTLYRCSWQAKYPAAINDLHAGYKWMIDNAEMLQINPDNVVLHGISSGAHLALSLGFRLKRYGYSPKGIVASMPQTDDRETDSNSHYIFSSWGGSLQHNALAQWLGINFASSRVGPEALANHATVKDCIGYPPTFIHSAELDADRDFNRAFYGKLLQAKTYAEYHCWGGTHHSCSAWSGVFTSGELNEYSERVKVVFDGNIEDCFKYDLRRPWTVEEAAK